MEYSRRPTKSIPKENQLKILNKIYQTYLVSTTYVITVRISIHPKETILRFIQFGTIRMTKIHYDANQISQNFIWLRTALNPLLYSEWMAKHDAVQLSNQILLTKR